MRRFKKYPKNDFDLLYINISNDIDNSRPLSATINYQKFIQCNKIFHHKLKVMEVAPTFSDKYWYENNFTDLLLFEYEMFIETGKSTKTLIVNGKDGNAYTCEISDEMYRVIKNYHTIVFVYYNGSVIDLFPLPDDNDINDYNNYNFKKNQTQEQMRLFKILFSKMEENMQPEWFEMDEEIDDIIIDYYNYQNLKYDYASDNSVILLSEGDVSRFLIDIKENFIDADFIKFKAITKKNIKGSTLKLVKEADIDITYKVPLTKAFYEIYKNCSEVMIAVKNFEVVDLFPISNREE